MPEALKNKKEVQQSRYNDVVGIELGGPMLRLVRLRRKNDQAEVIEIGELPPVNLPQYETAPVLAELRVPKQFAASYAAFAIGHPQTAMRMISLRKAPEEDEEVALAELFGASPPPDHRAAFARVGGEFEREEKLYVAAGLPDYLAVAVANLLPEARRPAPASLQLSEVARLNAFAMGPARRLAEGGVIYMQIDESDSTVSIFNRGRLIAQRQFPVGNGAIVAQVAQQFGLSNTLAEELLNENQIDPSNIINPVLEPLFRQISMSTDFVARRDDCHLRRIFLAGRFAGTRHWMQMAESALGVEAEIWMPFDDHPQRVRAMPKALIGREFDFTIALGAALALMGGA